MVAEKSPSNLPRHHELKEFVRASMRFSRAVGQQYCTPDSGTEWPNNATVAGMEWMSHGSVNRRVLSFLGVPFHFNVEDPDALLCFSGIIAFRDVATGVCPLPEDGHAGRTPEENFYHFALWPRELEERYGPARLARLQETLAPRPWDAVEPDSGIVGAALHEADAYVAAQHQPHHILGLVRVSVPAGWGLAGLHADISLADLTFDPHAPESGGAPMIRVGGDSAEYRARRQGRVRAKLNYGRFIAQHEEAIRAESGRVARAIGEEVDRAQRGLAAERRRQTSYERFLEERRQKGATVDHDERRRVANPFAADAERKGKKRRGQEAAACYRLSKALGTLDKHGVALDSRRGGLVTLMAKHSCIVHEVVGNTAASQPSSPPPLPTRAFPLSLCATYCDAVSHMSEWQQFTGQRATPSQSLALLLHLHANATSSGDDDYGADNRHLNTDKFIAQVSGWFTQSFYDACPCGTPRALKAELLHTAGVMALLAPAESGRPARGVLHLHQSMWLGSKQAAAALSTMREQGIYLKQHRKASAALLAASLSEAPANLYRRVWQDLRPSQGKAAWRAHVEQTLRGERVYATVNSWPQVDRPYYTKELVQRFFALDDVHFTVEEDEDEYEAAKRASLSVHEEELAAAAAALLVRPRLPTQMGPAGYRVRNAVTKAVFLFTGFTVRRNVHAAECDLLAALRRFDYLCDLDAFAALSLRRRASVSDLPADRNTGSGSQMPPSYAIKHRDSRELYDEQRAICPGGADVLDALLAKPSSRRFHCRGASSASARGGSTAPERIPVPIIEENYESLKDALNLLAYLYLAKGDYARAALYARLAIDLGAAVLRHAGAEDWARLSRGLGHMLDTGQVTSKAVLLRELRRLPRPWSDWWVRRVIGDMTDFDQEALLLLGQRQQGGGNTTSTTAGVDNHNSSDNGGHENRSVMPLSLVDSTIPVSEPLMILAMAVLLDDEPARTPPDPDEPTETVAVWTATQLLVGTFAAAQETAAALLQGRSMFTTAAASPQQEHRRGRQQVALLLLLSSVSQWRVVKYTGHTLDHTLHSLHCPDPFIIATWLIDDMGPHVSIAGIQSAAALLPRLLGSRPFLPLPYDTPSSYSHRLLRYSTKNVNSALGFAESFHRGRLHYSGGDVDSDMIRQPTASMLRWVKDAEIDRAQFFPLLYASDTHAYLTRSRAWTLLEKLSDAFLNGVAYLFTETTKEALLRELGLEILSPAPVGPAAANRTHDEGHGLPNDAVNSAAATRRPETRAPFVVDFLDMFGDDPNVRECTIAVQLLAMALESGRTSGFSLLFLEAAERENKVLAPLADQLATGVFGPATAAGWEEQHAVAQWNQDKPQTLSRGGALSLDMHSLFSHDNGEVRQEVMARVDRWRARALTRAYRRLDGPAAHRSESRHRRFLLRAANTLAPCSGLVTQAGLARWFEQGAHNTSVEPFLPLAPFDGMLFPAADPQCATDLLEVLETMAANGMLRFGAGDAVVFLDRVVGDMLSRIARYYRIASTEDRPLARSLPATERVFDGQRGHAAEEDGEDAAYGSETDTPAHDEESDPTDSTPDDDDDGDGDDDDGEEDVEDEDGAQRHKTHYYVEPWNSNRARDGGAPSMPTNGEGVFYNSRHHRVSGLLTGARMAGYWRWFKGLISH